MRNALILACMLTAAACAATTKPAARPLVRDLDGNALPANSIQEATLKLHCHDGASYLIVTDPPPMMTGIRLGNVYRFVHPTPHMLCERILAATP